MAMRETRLAPSQRLLSEIRRLLTGGLINFEVNSIYYGTYSLSGKTTV